MRSTRERIADARADAIEYLAKNPNSELRSWIGVLVRATAPPTKDEAIPVMIKNANEAGEWDGDFDDVDTARKALESKALDGPWSASIRAQWATLVHFCGGAHGP
jgi:hypothetical protein